HPRSPPPSPHFPYTTLFRSAIRDVREQMAAMAERSRLARELHDVLAHCLSGLAVQLEAARMLAIATAAEARLVDQISSARRLAQDRKSTRLNSSHQIISYAV